MKRAHLRGNSSRAARLRGEARVDRLRRSSLRRTIVSARTAAYASVSAKSPPSSDRKFLMLGKHDNRGLLSAPSPSLGRERVRVRVGPMHFPLTLPSPPAGRSGERVRGTLGRPDSFRLGLARGLRAGRHQWSGPRFEGIEKVRHGHRAFSRAGAARAAGRGLYRGNAGNRSSSAGGSHSPGSLHRSPWTRATSRNPAGPSGRKIRASPSSSERLAAARMFEM
jgi:hypothetical protein